MRCRLKPQEMLGQKAMKTVLQTVCFVVRRKGES